MAIPSLAELEAIFPDGEFDPSNLPAGVTVKRIGQGLEGQAEVIPVYDVTLQNGSHVLIPDLANSPNSDLVANSVDAALAMQDYVGRQR